jgi:hypothetical protein
MVLFIALFTRGGSRMKNFSVFLCGGTPLERYVESIRASASYMRFSGISTRRHRFFLAFIR